MLVYLKKPPFLMIFWGGFMIFIDQWSKHFAERKTSSILLCNNGISFGLPLPIHFTIFVSIFLFAFLSFLLYKAIIQKSPLEYTGFSCILFGAISNAADRIVYGCVRDFLPFFGLFKFNIADAAIFFGGVIVFFVFFKKASTGTR